MLILGIEWEAGSPVRRDRSVDLHAEHLIHLVQEQSLDIQLVISRLSRLLLHLDLLSEWVPLVDKRRHSVLILGEAWVGHVDLAKKITVKNI